MKDRLGKHTPGNQTSGLYLDPEIEHQTYLYAQLKQQKMR